MPLLVTKLKMPAPLGDEVEDAAPSLRVAGIPVLDGGIFDLGIVQNDYFHYCGVQLVLVPHGCGAALQVAHVGAFVGHDEGALELTCTPGIDPEVAGKLHRAVYSLGDVAEGAVGEDSGVEGRVVVIPDGHHRCQVLAHQVGIVAHGLRERAEDDAFLCQ